MLITDLKKDKKKLAMVVGGAFIVVAGLITVPMMVAEEEPEQQMVFGGKKRSANKAGGKKQERKKIVVPDPSYRQAPDFEDFHAIAKMYVHAMQPFKLETEQWEEELLTLRMQREKLALYEDAAKAAELRAEINRHNHDSENYLLENSGKDPSFESDTSLTAHNDIQTIDQIGSEDTVSRYDFKDVRMKLYSQGNKYSSTNATFTVMEEEFVNVRVNHVFGSQFHVISLDDDTFCAEIKDLSIKNSDTFKVCRN